MKTFKQLVEFLQTYSIVNGKKVYDKQKELAQGANAVLTQEGEVIDNWWCHGTIHSPSQQANYRPDFTKEQLHQLFLNCIKKVNSFSRKNPGEYLFFSQSLYQSIIADVSFDGINSQTGRMNSKGIPEIRVLTWLEQGHNEAKLSSTGKPTPKLVVESVEYTVIYID